jgi:hypothetical protein
LFFIIADPADNDFSGDVCSRGQVKTGHGTNRLEQDCLNGIFPGTVAISGVLCDYGGASFTRDRVRRDMCRRTNACL